MLILEKKIIIAGDFSFRTRGP